MVILYLIGLGDEGELTLRFLRKHAGRLCGSPA